MGLKRVIISSNFSLMAALLLTAPAAVAGNRSYELGLEASSNYRYADAVQHFQAAAEQGERDGQRNLGLMLLYGERLYGADVRRNREQAKRWLGLAAANGCEISLLVLKAMAQHDR